MISRFKRLISRLTRLTRLMSKVDEVDAGSPESGNGSVVVEKTVERCKGTRNFWKKGQQD